MRETWLWQGDPNLRSDTRSLQATESPSLPSETFTQQTRMHGGARLLWEQAGTPLKPS